MRSKRWIAVVVLNASVFLTVAVQTAHAQVRDYRGGRFEAEYTSPPAVGPGERLSKPPTPGAYVAFSLKVAQERVAKHGLDTDYRTTFPETFNLGGITRVQGVLLDRQAGDVVLVGVYDPKRQPLTLDDFTVALRSRFKFGEWPLVSIDPVESGPPSQTVRFEGGIQQTQFGADLLAADYLLKLIAFGIEVPAGVELQSEWESLRQRSWSSRHTSFAVNSRFWFYPILPRVLVRDDVVSIGDLQVGVFSEVLSAVYDGRPVKDVADAGGETTAQFAKQVTKGLDKLTSQYVCLSRLQGLQELTALVRSLEELRVEEYLSFWLRDYQVRPVRTPKRLEVVRRLGPHTSAAGMAYQLEGGVQLMALALRLKSGDVTALKQAVLRTRPSLGSQSWSFVVGNWVIPVEQDALTASDAGMLFAEFQYFLELGRLPEASICLDKIQKLAPEYADEVNIGRLQLRVVHAFQQMLGGISNWLRRTITTGSFSPIKVEDRQIRLQEIADAARKLTAQRRKPAVAYMMLGLLDLPLHNYDKAIENFNKTVEIDSEMAAVYMLRGLCKLADDKRREGLDDLARALQHDLPKELQRECQETIERARRNETGDRWATYRRPNEGFQFMYPADWDVIHLSDPRVLDFLRMAGLTQDAAEMTARMVRQAGNGVFVVNPYDLSSVAIEIRDVGQSVSKEQIKTFWRALLADERAIERKNSVLYENFRIRDTNLSDLGREVRIDFSYNFNMKLLDQLLMAAGRRAMIFETDAPSRTARVEYTCALRNFEARQRAYIDKIIDSLDLWIPRKN